MDEQESLEKLHAKISSVCDAASLKHQIIFVDDGSTDQSWNVIERLVAANATTEGIRFRRNFGKSAALSAGFTACCGDIVITMDADLQHPPEKLPEFIAAWEGGAELVSGVRSRAANVGVFKRLSSSVFYRALNLISQGSTLRA